MGRGSQVFGYLSGFIIKLIGLALITAGTVEPLLFSGGFSLIGLLVTIFGFVIMYIGHRSRPTKEKKMLKMQVQEYFREQKLNKEMEKRQIEEMEKAEKEREKAEKEREKE
ncbi:MAG TPA: hypothetical protein VFT83_06080 [Nitrososphaeraceae archaeon]|nr:hypothetical protein [Nitrososphaeraceae archaeon]